MVALTGRKGKRQGLRVRVSNVFRGKADQTPGNIEWFLSGGQHSRQPVQSAVRITVTQAFVERGDQVVMFLAVLVVSEALALDRLFRQGKGDAAGFLCAVLDKRACNLQAV